MFVPISKEKVKEPLIDEVSINGRPQKHKGHAFYIVYEQSKCHKPIYVYELHSKKKKKKIMSPYIINYLKLQKKLHL